MNDDPGAAGREPSDEELRAALEEQMSRITVDDVLVQTAVTLVNLGGRRLGLPGPEGPPPEGRDLGQARQAIEAVRALLPLLPAEPQTPIRDALSQLQMAFAREAQGSGGEAQGGEQPAGEPGAGAQTAGGEAPGQPGTSPEDAERAKARSKIWTPPGS